MFYQAPNPNLFRLYQEYEIENSIRIITNTTSSLEWNNSSISPSNLIMNDSQVCLLVRTSKYTTHAYSNQDDLVQKSSSNISSSIFQLTNIYTFLECKINCHCNRYDDTYLSITIHHIY